MWINISERETAALNGLIDGRTLLLEEKVAITEMSTRIKEWSLSQAHPEAQKYRDAVPVSDGDLECDDDAIVSKGDAAGAYVMTWKWVSDEEAGIVKEESSDAG